MKYIRTILYFGGLGIGMTVLGASVAYLVVFSQQVVPSPDSPDVVQGTDISSGKTPEVTGVPSTSEDLGTFRLLFAGDLATDAGCADHPDDDACDLYVASVNMETGAVSAVTRVTSTDASESYPAWNPNGSVGYYTVIQDMTHKYIGAVQLDAQKTQTFVQSAAWPTVSPDGKTFLFVPDSTHMMMQASLSTDGLMLGTSSPVTGSPKQEDPDFSPDGRYIVFHDTSSGQAKGAVYSMADATTAMYDIRSGHCAFGAFGLTLCDNVNGGGIFGSTYTQGVLSSSALFIRDQTAAQLAKIDSAFAGCQGASFNYPTFCGDNNHVLVSTSCNVGGSVTFSRLFLIDLSGDVPRYIPLGKSLADAYGGPGESTWTADCLMQ